MHRDRLRPRPEVGWNLLPGGGMPPSRSGGHWYTDGKTNVHQVECPEGFWPGKTQKSGPGHGLSGRPKSRSHRAKISRTLMGRKPSPQCAAAAHARRGVKKPMAVCPHCGVEGGSPAMARWHFNNCKRTGVQWELFSERYGEQPRAS